MALLYSQAVSLAPHALLLWLPLFPTSTACMTSPLSCKSFCSVGCFSLLLIEFFFFSLTSSFFLLPKKSLQSPSPRFSHQYFHSSLLNSSPLGYPFKQVPKPTAPDFPQAQIYHSAGWKWQGRGLLRAGDYFLRQI